MNYPPFSPQHHPSRSIGREVNGDGNILREDSDFNRGGAMEDIKLRSTPGLEKKESLSSSLEDDEQLESLHSKIAYFAKNSQDTPELLSSSSRASFSNAKHHLEECLQDDPSILTQDTIFRNMGSVTTAGTRKTADRRSRLGAINETTRSSSISRQSFLMSHRTSVPDIPHAAVAPAQDMGSYMKSTSPNLMAVREFVEMCNTAGLDEEAIDALKTALIHDNATSTSKDLALYCLTRLLILAGKRYDIKRTIIFDGNYSDGTNPPGISAFDAIIEAAQIYEGSAEIQHMVCAILWSLSTKFEKHVTQHGGCKAILYAMRNHVKVDKLQVMALGALTALSFDSVGRWTLLSRDGMSTVADSMHTHVHNPTIQSRGCVILGNLTVDEERLSAVPVSEKVVDAIIKGMLSHPSSLEVHEAA